MRKGVVVAAVLAIVVVPATTVYILATLRSQSPRQALSGPPPGPYRGSEPPPGIRAPDLALRSYRGPWVRMRDLRGKVVLVTFLDTDCTTKCPIIAREIGAALRTFSESERQQVRAIALTVNPAKDTPRAVASFLRRRHAVGLDFLLGTTRRMRPVWRAFHVLSAAETGNADVHSADVRIFDCQGRWVATQHVPVDLTAANLVHDARVALRRCGTE